MEFEVSTDPEKGKLIARRLVLLPSGTVSFESVGEERLLGKVDVEPQLVRTSEPDIHRGGSRRNMGEFRDPGLGRIIYERQGVCSFVLTCTCICIHVHYLTKITYVSRMTHAICNVCYMQDQFTKYCRFVGGMRAVGSRAYVLYCACVIQENGCKFVANTSRILSVLCG